MAASYFFLFAAYGITLPFLSPVLQSMGYSRQDSGLILGFIYLCHAILPVVGTRLSDRFGSADRLVRVCAFAMTGFALLLWWKSGETSFWFLLLLFGYASFRSPLIPLLDTLAMQVSENRPKPYARMRVAGSVGFAFAVTGLGYLAEARGLKIFFPVLAVSAALLLFHSLALPSERKSEIVDRPRDFWRHLGGSWWLWLSAMALHWFCFGPYNYGFSLFLAEQGIPRHHIGWYWSIGVGVEIAIFFTAGWFFSRWHYRTLLFAALTANLVRWCLLGLFPNPWVIALSQTLHGPGFALFYAAALQAIHQFSGAKDRASYQGVFSTVVSGIGTVLGTAWAGWLHESMPFRRIYFWFLPFQFLAILLLTFQGRRRQVREVAGT